MANPPSHPTRNAALSAFDFDVDAIRKRPGMYVGDTQTYGLYHLIYLLLDAAVHRQGPGRAHHLAVELFRNGACSVFDSGRPLSHARLASVLSRLEPEDEHDPLRFEWMCPNALSRSFQVDTWDGRAQWQMRTCQGKPQGEPERVSPPEAVPLGLPRGTRVRFTPDASIFKSGHTFASHTVARRLRELAFLFPGLTTHLHDRRTGHQEVRTHPDGLVGLIEERSEGMGTPAQVIAVDHEWNGLTVRAAFRWRHAEQPPEIVSFANTVRTRGGGKHEVGLVRALCTALQSVSPHRLHDRDPRSAYVGLPISVNALTRGLLAAVSVTGPRSKIAFVGPTKTTLGIDGLDRAIAEALAPKIASALAPHRDALAPLVEAMREYDVAALGPHRR